MKNVIPVTSLIRLNSTQLDIINSWDEGTIESKFQTLTKISEMTMVKGFKKLSMEAKKEALLKFIGKQPCEKWSNVNSILQPKVGSTRMFKDGLYEFKDLGDGKFGYRMVKI